MNKYLLITLPLCLYSTAGIADCNPDALRCMNTIQGPLESITRVDSGDDYSYLKLNGKEIYKAKTAYMVVGNDDGVFKGKKYLRTKATISYGSDNTCYPDKPGVGPRCSMNVVLDLTSGKPVISNEFFADYGPSQITWVSWGKANSVIVIDDYLRFKYANGHVEQITKVKEAADTSSGGK